MKTYSLEELKLAQAKGCRIEYKDPFGNWVECSDREDRLHIYACLRIHPDDEWKARLPRLRDGAEWCCDGSKFVGGYRPHIIGEWIEGMHESLALFGFGNSTTSPIPPEFLHPDELAKTWCPVCAAYTDHGSGACPHHVTSRVQVPAAGN